MKKFNQIVEAFNNGQYVMVLLKNISVSQCGERYLRTEASTIITSLVNNFAEMVF